MTKDEEYHVVYAEDGEDFQKYVFDDTGLNVPEGEPIGIENNHKLILLHNVRYKND